jgi:hypothetical protein
MNNERYEQAVPRQGEPNLPDRVISLESSHTAALASALSRAFHDEPYFKYMVPDENERRSVLPGFLNSIIDVSHSHGETYTTPAVKGGAVWIRPDQTSTFQRSVWARLCTTNFTLSPTSLRRCIRLSTRLEQVRRQLTRSPHWYLLALGLDPAYERSLIRPALLQPVLARADSDGTCCYLETLQERRLSFYEGQGFRIEGCGRISQDGPRFWSMIRVPHR